MDADAQNEDGRITRAEAEGLSFVAVVFVVVIWAALAL